MALEVYDVVRTDRGGDVSGEADDDLVGDVMKNFAACLPTRILVATRSRWSEMSSQATSWVIVRP